MSGNRRTYCRHCKKGSRVPDYCPHCGADKKSAQPWRPPRVKVEPFPVVSVNDERFPPGRCWICGDPTDHNDTPHDEATGDPTTRYDIINRIGESSGNDQSR